MYKLVLSLSLTLHHGFVLYAAFYLVQDVDKKIMNREVSVLLRVSHPNIVSERLHVSTMCSWMHGGGVHVLSCADDFEWCHTSLLCLCTHPYMLVY